MTFHENFLLYKADFFCTKEKNYILPFLIGQIYPALLTYSLRGSERMVCFLKVGPPNSHYYHFWQENVDSCLLPFCL